MLFISHKTEDKDVANEVLRRALEHGYSDKQIFLDSDPGSGIEAGAAWERSIYESLKHSRAMIVLCSPNWLKSKWCYVELGYAKAMAISVFPIIIEPCEVGSTLSATQAIDLTWPSRHLPSRSRSCFESVPAVSSLSVGNTIVSAT